MTYGDLWGSRKGGNRSGQGSDAKGGELHRVGVCWERVLWKGVSVVVSAVSCRQTRNRFHAVMDVLQT